MELSTLWLFIITAIFLIVVPGPSVFYIIARSIDQGKNAGLTSVIGVACGTTIHIIGAGIGISALLMTSAFAFNIVKYLGAAYLIYLGLKTLFFSKDSTSSIPKIKQINLRKVFYQSVIVETLNPCILQDKSTQECKGKYTSLPAFNLVLTFFVIMHWSL